MTRLLHILWVLVLVCTSRASQFTWPEAISNRGPYTLVSTINNVIVFSPNGNAVTEDDIATHRYSHHTRIWHFNGVTAIAFSSAGVNEADGGMQCAISFSSNRGNTWTNAIQAIGSQSRWTNVYYDTIGDRISYPRNFQLYNGTNYLVCAVDELWTNTNSTEEVGAALIACPIYTNQTIGTQFLISTNIYARRDERPVVLPELNETMRSAMMPYSKLFGRWGGNTPYFVTEWTHTAITGSGFFYEPSTFPADDSGTNYYRFWRVTGDWDTDPGIDAYLVAQQYSTNSGTTWSAITGTTIPNDPSVTCGVRLADGRFAVLGNPAPYSGLFRDPLYLGLTAPNSTAITNVWAIRQGLNNADKLYDGYGKTGACSYVDAVQVGNYLYVSYSIYKEDIGFSRVLIPGLENNNNDLVSVSTVQNLSIGGNLIISQ